MGRLKKVTVVLPADLLKRAQRASAEGVTETIRRGLELLARHETYQRILAMRGKVHLGLNLKELREDRR